MGFVGYPFTWTIHERFDRFLAIDLWNNLYPSIKITHEARTFSDHNPVLLEFNRDNWGEINSKKGNFRFEEAWLKESNCDKIVEATWALDGSILDKINQTKMQLMNSDLFNLKGVHIKINEIENNLEKIQ